MGSCCRKYLPICISPSSCSCFPPSSSSSLCPSSSGSLQCLLPGEGPDSDPAAEQLPRPQTGPSLPACSQALGPLWIWPWVQEAPGWGLYTGRGSRAGAGGGLLRGRGPRGLGGSISGADTFLGFLSVRGFPLGKGLGGSWAGVDLQEKRGGLAARVLRAVSC